MLYPKRTLLYAFLLSVLLDPISGRKGFRGLGRLKSNRHTYPKGGGLSGSGSSRPYLPPKSNPSYSPSGGGHGFNHKNVYHGPPPNYVTQYQNSGSKYGSLLAGLSLLNLGVLGVSAYSHLKGNSKHTPEPGEVCKFEMKKDNGDYEQTKIDCQIISSFILQDQAHLQPYSNNTVSVNATGIPGVSVIPPSPNATPNVTGAVVQNGVVTPTVVTTTATKTTLVNALDVKGKPVEVTPGMQCFVSRTSPTHNMRKNVPCGLLQTYADRSIQQHKNSAARNGRILTVMTVILASCVAY